MRRFGTLIAVVIVVAGCANDSDPSATTDGSTTTIAPSANTTTSWPTTASTPTTTTAATTTTSTTSTTTTTAVAATPPTLVILDPEAGSVVASSLYVFRGVTDPGCTVDVGGKYFADVDEKGDWSLELMLRSGWNATTFTATDASGMTSVRQVSVARRLPMAEAIIGAWVGTAEVPESWWEIGEVWFEFRSDGTYSVRNGALYVGDDFDTYEKTYDVWENDDPATAAVEGAGRIALTWDGEAQRFAQIASLVMEPDGLRFERWDRGSGPIVYDLRRAPSDYCVDDYWEGMDGRDGVNHGRSMTISRTDENLSYQKFDGTLCPGDSDLHHFWVDFFPRDFPPGEEVEITQRVTVTSHGDGAAPIRVTLYHEVSNWVGRSYADMTVQSGEQGSIDHVWVVAFESLESWSSDPSWSVELSSADTDAHSYSVEIELIDPRD